MTPVRRRRRPTLAHPPSTPSRPVYVALALHLACLVLLAAGGIGGGFLHLVLTRVARREPRQAVRVARIGARFGMVASSAALLMLASGIALLAARGWDDLG